MSSVASSLCPIFSRSPFVCVRVTRLWLRSLWWVFNSRSLSLMTLLSPCVLATQGTLLACCVTKSETDHDSLASLGSFLHSETSQYCWRLFFYHCSGSGICKLPSIPNFSHIFHSFINYLLNTYHVRYLSLLFCCSVLCLPVQLHLSYCFMSFLV